MRAERDEARNGPSRRELGTPASSGLPTTEQRRQVGQDAPLLHVRGLRGQHRYPPQAYDDVEFARHELQQLPTVVLRCGQESLGAVTPEPGRLRVDTPPRRGRVA